VLHIDTSVIGTASRKELEAIAVQLDLPSVGAIEDIREILNVAARAANKVGVPECYEHYRDPARRGKLPKAVQPLCDQSWYGLGPKTRAKLYEWFTAGDGRVLAAWYQQQVAWCAAGLETCTVDERTGWYSMRDRKSAVHQAAEYLRATRGQPR
jgi:hypothetical protein